MKSFLIVVTLIFISLLIASQVFFLIYDRKIETHRYQVIDQVGVVEIRDYEPAIFAAISLKGNMSESQGEAFGQLAGYIFGGNDKNQKIAMTAPVQMQDDGDHMEMKFMLPTEYSREELPEPLDSEVKFIEQDGYRVAAISYGGFSNDSRFEKYKRKLQQVVQENNLHPLDGYFFQGHNAPFQLIGRKNEVLVKLQPVYSGT